MLERVDCAAAPVRTSDGPASTGRGAVRPRDRFHARRDEYTRAVAGAGERLTLSVRR